MGQVVLEVGVLLVMFSLMKLFSMRGRRVYAMMLDTPVGLEALRRLVSRHGVQAVERWRSRLFSRELHRHVGHAVRSDEDCMLVFLRATGWMMLAFVAYLGILRSGWVLIGIAFSGGASVNLVGVVVVHYLLKSYNRRFGSHYNRAEVAWAQHTLSTNEAFTGMPARPPVWGSWRPAGTRDDND